MPIAHAILHRGVVQYSPQLEETRAYGGGRGSRGLTAEGSPRPQGSWSTTGNADGPWDLLPSFSFRRGVTDGMTLLGKSRPLNF
jgi:hypothetical protein